ncbi:hypothetical protein [uncultured Prevotella sp.]|uniref:hypothetical protein n=1 Tax=uncultured Prevotella sp. TaxID=159272 RepID=UPI0026DD49C1|nr:hypothetical protein [uncultured Prevotella sp.]
MKRLMDVKVLIFLTIICVGTYFITFSFAITAGVAILAVVIDNVYTTWLDKKEKEYFQRFEKNKSEKNKSEEEQ